MQIPIALAILLHEARRADPVDGAQRESDAAVLALVELLGIRSAAAADLLEQGCAAARQHSSFYPPVSVIKREFSMKQRIRLLEHLWRVSFADGRLNLYEDHYVRKIAHLLYVTNTDNMLARNRARDALQQPLDRQH